MSEPQVEDILKEMKTLRRETNEDVEEFVESAKTLGEWRRYVKAYPWICVGAAAAAGYFLVPTKTNVMRPDAATLAQLARHERLVVSPHGEAPRQTSLAGTLFNLAASALVRGAVAYAGQNVGKLFVKEESEL